MNSVGHSPPMGEGRSPTSPSPTPATVYVHQVRLSNGDRPSLRMLPVDARELWLNLGVALGELPALPATDDE